MEKKVNTVLSSSHDHIKITTIEQTPVNTTWRLDERNSYK